VAADPAPNPGSAHSQGAWGSGPTIHVTSTQGTGLLGSVVAPVVSQISQTLISTLFGTLGQVFRSVVNFGGGMADTTTGPYSYPTSPWPALGIPGLITLGVQPPSGSVTADANGYSAAAQVFALDLSVLGISLIHENQATASVSCPNAGSAALGNITFTGITLLNGLVGVTLSNVTNLWTVTFAGNPVVMAPGGVVSLPLPGNPLTVGLNGNLLSVSLGIDLNALLGGLGLGGILNAISGIVDTRGTNLRLTLTFGPGGATTGGTQAMAWGTEMGLDLSGTLSVGLLSILGGLIGSASISIPTGIGGTSYGNILDLKYGYASCTTGAPPPPGPQWIPPGLI
jgi:hypothetical protein